MVFMIQAKDGKFLVSVEACDIGAAFEAMAHRFEYETFAAFCTETGYTREALTVSVIVDQRKHEHDFSLSSDYIQEQRERTVLRAFKNWIKRR